MDESNPEATSPGTAPTAPSLPALPPPMYAPTGPRPPKSPGVALFLSFLFPGMGQVYNGQFAKAVFMLAALVGSIYGVVEVGPFPFAFCIPFVYFFNLIDAYRSASIINERALGGVPVPEEEGMESPLWGASLVAMGLLLLLNNLGWLRLAALARYWPLALVVGGGVLLYQSLNRRRVDRTPPSGRDAFLS
jgi:TM2 domain-containing membrane protein YozV